MKAKLSRAARESGTRCLSEILASCKNKAEQKGYDNETRWYEFDLLDGSTGDPMGHPTVDVTKRTND